MQAVRLEQPRVASSRGCEENSIAIETSAGSERSQELLSLFIFRARIAIESFEGMLTQFVESDGLARTVLVVLACTTLGCLSYTWGYYEVV